MKVIEVYKQYKDKYAHHILIIKEGMFYRAYNKDTGPFYKIFGYKILKNGNSYMIGFPSNIIDNVIEKLKNYKINYVLLDKDEDKKIIEKDIYTSDENNYNKYILDFNRITYLDNRIQSIYDNLQLKKFNDDIESILSRIEEIM